MGKNQINKKSVILITAALAAMIIVLLLLIPVERKRLFYEKWGSLAELAETDERAKFITENEELYPAFMLDFYYMDNDDLDFVYNYPFHKDDYKSMTFTEEELNSETVPALYMYDNRWAYETLGEYYIRKTGCMTISLTMANLYLNHNSDVDPRIVAASAENLGCLGVFGGIINEKLNMILTDLGFEYVEYECKEGMDKSESVGPDTIRGILDSGHVCLAAFSGETFGTHAIIIREITDDGKIMLNDPANAENTAKIWDLEQLEKEIIFLWDLS